MPDNDNVRSCDACGASIYPEHIERHLAGDDGGQLLCMHCLKERRDGRGGSAEDALQLVAEEDVGGGPGSLTGGVVYDRKPTAIRSFGGGPTGMPASGTREHAWRRALQPGAGYATRCRTFHCKLADAAMSHMNEQINEWADGDDSIEIKFATSSIGVVEGKHADPHLIVTVFY